MTFDQVLAVMGNIYEQIDSKITQVIETGVSTSVSVRVACSFRDGISIVGNH